jgi:Xaa-Pro aminopeptidase
MKKDRCINFINDNNADAMLLLDEANMHYVCAFSPSEGVVLLTKDGFGYHLVDSRYTEKAQIKAKTTGLTVIEINSKFTQQVKELCQKHNVKSLLFENETISLKKYQAYKNELDNIDFVPINDGLMKIRNCKDMDEIVLMKKANEIAEKSFLELLNHIEVGKSEKELSAYFDYLMAKNGSHGLSFDTILLTGAHTSMPHGTPDDRTIKEGDFVLFDFGATYEGYHSDMTRTIAVKHADEEMTNAYELVKKAQLAGIQGLNAGVKCADVYKKAYDVLEEQHMGKYFRHSLGHGVGLEIHEGFNASPKSKDTYQVGNVTSIEPGIYIPNKFGIRIEDVLYLSPRGRENLSSITKKLIIL